MSIIEREAEAVEAPEQPPVQDAAPAPEAAPERRCAECGAELQPDQDWCLECGTAQPDRPGARPGWRTAAAVLATTGVLASGAVAAAYAGLSNDAKKSAAPNAQAALPAQPAQPAPAAPAAPATPPAAATPAPATPPATTTPKAVTPPVATPPAATATPPAATPTPTPKTTTPTTTKKSTGSSTSTTTKKNPTANTGPLTPVKLQPDAAQTYNPYARPTTDFTDAKLAIDGDPNTSWTAAFNGGDTLLGVVLDLGKSTGIRALQLVTTTPGMTVEIYAARGAQPPASLQDPKWDHIATQLDVAKDGRIRLGNGTEKYRWVLVWPTEGPAAGGNQIALSELKPYS